jgi:hypothetical protein
MVRLPVFRNGKATLTTRLPGGALTCIHPLSQARSAAHVEDAAPSRRSARVH